MSYDVPDFLRECPTMKAWAMNDWEREKAAVLRLAEDFRRQIETQEENERLKAEVAELRSLADKDNEIISRCRGTEGRLRSEIQRIKSECLAANQRFLDACTRADQQAAWRQEREERLAGMKQEQDRLDWMQENLHAIVVEASADSRDPVFTVFGGGSWVRGGGLRESIDQLRGHLS